MMFIYPQDVTDTLYLELFNAIPIISTGDYGYDYSVKYVILEDRKKIAVYEHPELGVYLFDDEEAALAEFNRYCKDRQLEMVTMSNLKNLKELYIKREESQ